MFFEAKTFYVTCRGGILGEVLTNRQTIDTWSITGSNLGGFEEGELDCYSAAYGPVAVSAAGLPWTVQLSEKHDNHPIFSVSPIGFTFTFLGVEGQPSCTLVGSSVKGRVGIEAPLYLYLKNKALLNTGGSCMQEGEFQMRKAKLTVRLLATAEEELVEAFSMRVRHG